MYINKSHYIPTTVSGQMLQVANKANTYNQEIWPMLAAAPHGSLPLGPGIDG